MNLIYDKTNYNKIDNILDKLEKRKFNFHKNKIIKNLYRFFKNPRRFFVSIITKVIKFRIIVKSKSFYGYDFIFPMFDYDAFDIYISGVLNRYNEYKLIKFLIKNLHREKTFYDVGANYGFCFYTFLGAFCEAEVHSFEPNPYVFYFLKETYNINIKKFKNKVIINNFGLGDSEKEEFLYFTVDHSGGGSIYNSDTEKSKKVKIKITTLDKYVSSHAKPDIIKLDVEGYEYNILNGELMSLSKYKPIVIIEFLPKEYGLFNYHKNA